MEAEEGGDAVDDAAEAVELFVGETCVRQS